MLIRGATPLWIGHIGSTVARGGLATQRYNAIMAVNNRAGWTDYGYAYSCASGAVHRTCAAALSPVQATASRASNSRRRCTPLMHRIQVEWVVTYNRPRGPILARWVSCVVGRVESAYVTMECAICVSCLELQGAINATEALLGERRRSPSGRSLLHLRSWLLTIGSEGIPGRAVQARALLRQQTQHVAGVAYRSRKWNGEHTAM